MCFLAKATIASRKGLFKLPDEAASRTGLGFTFMRMGSFFLFLIQNTLRVVHSPIVEKLPVVDKTLPPDNFYLAKAPSSGQLSVVDKKIWDFYEILLFAFL